MGRPGQDASRSERALLVGLVVAAVRWRGAASLAVLLAATTAFAAAALGPLWATATADALGTQQVTAAAPAEREVVVEAAANVPSGGVVTVPVVALLQSEQAIAVGGAAGRALGPPRLLLATSGRLLVRSGTGPAQGAALLAWMDGACSRLPLLSGTCGAGGALVSERTARDLGLRVGSVVELPELGREPERPGSGDPYVRRFPVAGVYQVGGAEQEHWASTDLFRVGPPIEVDGRVVPARLDAVLVERPVVEDLSRTAVTGSARRSLVPVARTAPELAAVQAGLDAHVRQLSTEVGRRVRAPALALLTDVSRQADAAERVALVLGAQLLLLACCVLGLVVAGSADARSADVALGRLRGLRRTALAAFCAAEPLLVTAAAVPLGLGAGAGAAAALAAAVLPGEVALRADAWLAVAMAVAVLSALLAVAVGVRIVLARAALVAGPAEDGDTRPARLVLDAVLVTGAVAVLLRVAHERSATGTGLLAPVLGALAAGVLVARLARQVARSGTSRVGGGSGVAGFLALRRTARTSGGARTVLMVAAALACTTYGAVVLTVTEDQRGAQAAMTVGAETAYRVEPVPVERLLAGVRLADPSGRQLMAVMTPTRDDRPDDARLLGVDTSRLGAVGAWRQEWGGRELAVLADRLRPETAPPVLLTGRRVSLDLRAEVESGRGALVGLEVVTTRGIRQTVRLGALRAGDSRLTGELRSCADGCRLAGLFLQRPRPVGPLVGTLLLRALVVDGVPVAGIGDPAGWRPAPVEEDPLSAPSGRLQAAAGEPDGALAFVYAQSEADRVGVVRGDLPPALPVLVAGRELRPLGGRGLVALSVPGPLSEVVPAESAGRAQVLPRLGRSGSLVDLALLQRTAPVDVRTSTQEVWSAGPDSAATRAALERAGLTISSVSTRHEVEAELDGRGQAQVLGLLPVVALAALGLAGLGQVAQALASARSRAVEAAALHAVGVPRGALHRAALLESGVLLSLGALSGVAVGVLTAVATAPQVGRLGLEGAQVPFPDGVPWVPLLLTVAVAGAVLTVVVAAAAAIGLRGGDGRLLRQDAT